AEAARRYALQYGALAGKRAVVFTGNDDAYRTAFVLKAGGAAIAAIVDLRADPQGILPAQARAAGIPVLAGHAIVATSGRKRVDGVTVAPMAADGRSAAGAAQRLPCDVVAMSGGWNPAVHLFSQAGGKLRWDEATSAFGPDPRTVPGNKSLACVGAANGTFGLAACIAEGLEAGAAAARVAGFGAGAMPGAPKVDTAAEASARTLWLVPGLHPLGLGSAKRFVDFQNDVTAADLRLAVREGYRSVEHVKRYTTTGMATDQGKLANVTALGIVAEALGESVPAVGTTTFRPPYTPIPLGTLAGRQVGAFFDPVRATPMHAWHARSGCPFEDVGQWKRPWYYPRKGEDLHAAVAREVKAVRARVGVLDASTLGKIDIQGPDAAELLNRVYTNAWSKLEVGRCRYGLMCRDDGMVFDDGVTTRIGPQRFLMTTTTGGAARVLGWLEEWLQTEWPELKVWCTSVTEQWAVAQLAGPQSRAVLQALAPDLDLSGAAFPHMSMRAATVAGLPARVFRISFTGELSYEINVPAGHGLALWEAIMAAGAPLGIVPFGTETMHVMRAEKGFIIVGQETDGSVTPADLGMDWIVSKQKPDFIGKRGMLRTDSLRPDRKQLVGLLTDDPQAVLPEGAQLVEKVLQQPPMAMLGHVTSSYRSPTLGRSIALALVKGGRARLGAKLHAPLMDGRVLAATVVEPVFYDKEGARLAA
ncbi:MAG: sarcosine oxidase subunit alpha, partial [Alphaproteobacteria bacterium]|nr:sarcosine oxidase subunit alpha [Alphaproteobacteria bacterium]